MMLQVYDRIIPQQAYGTLTMLIIGVCIALLCEVILRSIRAWLIGWTAASNEHAGTCAALERFFTTNITDFTNKEPGLHLQHLGAISRLREFYSGQSLTALIDLPFAMIFLFMIAYIGGILVSVPIFLLVFFAIFAVHSGNLLRQRIETRGAKDNLKNSYLINTLTGIHTIKSMGMESQMLSMFEERQAEVTKASYRVASATGLAAVLSNIFSQLAQVLTMILGCILVLKGDLTMGGLSASTLLVGRALQPVQRVMGTWLRLQDFAVAKKQAAEIFSLSANEYEKNELPIPKGALSIKNISFGYNENLLLKNISLEVNPGEVIAITGEKGSGKSTLLQIITGVLQAKEGTINIDGIAPSTSNLAELNSHIGYLPQQGKIFKGTILENMTGFEDNENIIAISKHIGHELALDRVVDLLPKGYHTKLSDSLSDPIPPGIKQRIAICRILKNMPAVILFDDSDRTLDKEGYNLLFKMIGRLKGERTIIMVSYDQNLLSFADRSYYLKNGDLQDITQNNSSSMSIFSNLMPGGL